MISIKKENEVRRLLSLGTYSQREICSMVGVSRATVNSIMQGKFHLSVDKQAQERRMQDSIIPLPYGPLVRCPGCGGMVLMPCLLCYVTNGKKSSDCHSTITPPEDRVCILCHERKPAVEFRSDVTEAGGELRCYHTCFQCRGIAIRKKTYTKHRRVGPKSERMEDILDIRMTRESKKWRYPEENIKLNKRSFQ